MDLSGTNDCRLASRLGAYLARQKDLARTLAAADFSETGGIASDLIAQDGRLYWTAAYLDTADGRAALDLTATGLLDAGFDHTPFLVNATHVAVDGSTLHVTGTVHDVLGRLGDAATARVRIDVTGRLGGRVWTGPVSVQPHEDGWQFAAEVELGRVGRRMVKPTVGHEMRLTLDITRDGRSVRRTLSARDAVLPQHDVPVPSPWRWLLGARLRVAEVNGRLLAQFTDFPAAIDASIEVASRLRLAGRRALLRRAGH